MGQTGERDQDGGVRRPDLGELMAAVAAVARELLQESDTQQTLDRAVALAAGRPGGEGWASVSLLTRRGRQVDTRASSDERASRADQLQYQLAEGPCLDAIWQPATFQVHVDDLTRDARYPRWARRAYEDTGIASCLSLRLFTARRTLGALNLYSPHRQGFDERTREEGQAFSAQLAAALQAAQTQEQLRAAVESRTVIGQAQGILMERYRIDAGQAFQALTRISQTSNVRLAEIAQRLVDTGRLPGTWQPD